MIILIFVCVYVCLLLVIATPNPNCYSKIIKYKINSRKPKLFLYTSTNKLENTMKL